MEQWRLTLPVLPQTKSPNLALENYSTSLVPQISDHVWSFHQCWAFGFLGHGRSTNPLNCHPVHVMQSSTSGIHFFTHADQSCDPSRQQVGKFLRKNRPVWDVPWRYHFLNNQIISCESWQIISYHEYDFLPQKSLDLFDRQILDNHTVNKWYPSSTCKPPTIHQTTRLSMLDIFLKECFPLPKDIHQIHDVSSIRNHLYPKNIPARKVESRVSI